MAQVEIYKLNNHAPPELRNYGMFEFFGMADGPSAKHYCREWAGELETGDLQSLCGMLMLNPPDGYHGGPLGKTDIVVLDGEAFFLDKNTRGFDLSLMRLILIQPELKMLSMLIMVTGLIQRMPYP